MAVAHRPGGRDEHLDCALGDRVDLRNVPVAGIGEHRLGLPGHAAACELTEGSVERSRPQLDACLQRLGEGDTLIVWRLDRLGRSLRHLLACLPSSGERGVAFRSLSEAIDTTIRGGLAVGPLFAALTEFERSLGQERTRAEIRKHGSTRDQAG